MTDHSAAAPLQREHEASGFLTRVIVAAGKRMLGFEPEGSLRVHLPDGGHIRLGRPCREEAVLHIRDFAVILKSIRGGSVGFAEAYMDGDIDSPDLAALFGFFLRNREKLTASGGRLFRSRFAERIRHLARANTKRGSRKNISEHYDLGNAFFSLWLTGDRFYSSAYFETGAETLAEAQARKAKLVLDALDLQPGGRLLEIGSGWGELSLRAAQDYGARTYGITLSHEQLAGARECAAAAGFDGQCSFALQDYRDLTGQYDRIASVEMIEAVGEANWPGYFRMLHDQLKPGGIAALQAITIAEPLFDAYRRKADFIQRHIFPGGMLPTQSAMLREAARAGLSFETVKTFGHSYARTVREWRDRFEANWPAIAKLGFDDRFRRKWRYYLAYCEAGFLEGAIDVGVYRLARPALSACS